MKVQATLSNLRISPRKVRLVTHALIGVDTREALLQLLKMVKKSSDPLYTLLASAVANASNNFGLDEDNLYVHAISVGDGLRLERWLPRAFGRATPLIRRGSNVTITLEERIEGKNRTEKKKAIKEKTAVQEVATSETEAEKKDDRGVTKALRPEIKQESGREMKPTAQRTVKKMFQRKSS
ncbi:MAG: 50S ribosomal protein L22 [Candidatus Moranbacteria bacterium]|nr:50S ribosomal protein L22 [Candidatus Moranbacteria bacterium]